MRIKTHNCHFGALLGFLLLLLPSQNLAQLQQQQQQQQGSTEKDFEIEAFETETAHACEGQDLNIGCPDTSNGNKVIKIIRANYGRFSIAVCNPQVRTNYSVNCFTRESTEVVRQRCDFQKSCHVQSKSDIFGTDPCPGTPKYLEVHYACVRGTFLDEPTASPMISSPDFTTSTEKRPPPITAPSSSTTVETTTTATNTKRPRKLRVPITAKPTASPARETESKEMLMDKTDLKKLDNITAKFISVSLTSTNIMDTSEAPIEVTSTTTIASTTTEMTTSTTSSTTTHKVTTTTTTTTTANSYPRRVNNPIEETSSPYYSPSVFFEPTRDYLENEKNSQEDIFVTKHEIDLDRPSCPPRLIRTLEWPRTSADDQVATVACPLGTNGVARWKCSMSSEWEPSYPDLSQCESLWLTKIHEQLKHKESVVHLAKEMAHYATFNPLYGGDIRSLIDAIGVMSEKMALSLPEIPTVEQREAVVMEVVQGVMKTASLMMEEKNQAAWLDLGGVEDQRRTLTFLVRALKGAGMLLPMTVRENQEITISSPNILMSVKKINFHHMSHLKFPSAAARATKDWMGFQDRVDVPSLVLMENMDKNGAEVIFVAFKDLANLIGLKPKLLSQSEGDVFLNAKVSYVSMHTSHVPMLPEPVKLTFQHNQIRNVSNPRCVNWDEVNHGWNNKGCKLVETNSTHSLCLCGHFGLFGLMEEVVAEPVETGLHVSVVVGIVIAAIILFCVVISLAIGFDYCKRVQTRHKWQNSICKKTNLPCFQNQQDSPTRNFYISHHSRSNSYNSQTIDAYMEIEPNNVNINPRPQAGPQSSCNSIRRKSTAFDHHYMQPPTSPSTVTTTPLSTPERPLLMNFQPNNNNNLSSPERSNSALNHIYVEVDNRSELHFQPIQFPILQNNDNNKENRFSNHQISQLSNNRPSEHLGLATVHLGKPGTGRKVILGNPESSNSSQSSGYYSSPTINRALKQQELILQQQSARNNTNNSSHSSPIKTISLSTRHLEIQDSQFI